MFLKSLSIASRGETVREIVFHKGLNLIVDHTEVGAAQTGSGNNVGKTTVLRLIDFALGGDQKQIYRDPEFRGQYNDKVRSFLEDGEVVITLILKEDLQLPGSSEIVIRRNFLKRSARVLEVNGQPFSSLEKFKAALKELIFDHTEKVPSFRQLCAKYIRHDGDRLRHTVRVLTSTTKNVDYEQLYLFWFGLSDASFGSRVQKLGEKNAEDTFLKKLGGAAKARESFQHLEIIRRNIEALEEKRDSFNVNESYQEDLEAISEIHKEISSLSSEQARLELRRDLIHRSLDELAKDRAGSNTAAVAELYGAAKRLLPSLHKSYEETVAFHNAMVAERVRYLSEGLPEVDRRIAAIKHELQRALSEESRLKGLLAKGDVLVEQLSILDTLRGKYEEKGKYQEQIAQIEEVQARLEKINTELGRFDEELDRLDAELQRRLVLFNRHFAEISAKLYGEQFALSGSREKRSDGHKYYSLEISSVSGRLGSGKKKGEIAAFDIAVVKFSDEMGLTRPHFILHDQLELIDDNQMLSLRDVVVNANCQLIVPILRDKLPSELDERQFSVITLSQQDKLFRI